MQEARADDPLVRKSVSLPVSLWAEVADFRWQEKIGTEAEAIRRLLVYALRRQKGTKAR